MNTSEQINELAAAMAKAQSGIQAASKSGKNPHLGKSYATLTTIWEACREHLTANGVAVFQAPTTTDEGAVAVTTRLAHSSGQWAETTMACRPAKADAQGMGSVVTYLRKYSLAAMVGVAPDDDDDGESAVGRGADVGNGGEMRPQAPKRAAKPAPQDTRVANADAMQGPPRDFDPTDEPATVPYTASNGRVYDIGVDNAVQRLWKACEAAEVSDEAFDDLLRRNEKWMERHAKTALASMRQTKSAVAA